MATPTPPAAALADVAGRVPGPPLLELVQVTKAFGGLVAVRDVSLTVRQGEIFSIIGPNGAGKSTLFNLITGVLRLTRGDVRFGGQSIAGWPPHRVARLGIARTFQTTQVFPEKSVLENVLVGRHAWVRTGLWQALLRTRAFLAEEEAHRRAALAVLEEVGLAHLARRVAGTLSTAEQQRLAIAMALASQPRLLLLDEPTGGLLEQEVAEMTDLIRRIRGQGVTVVLIEHKMRLVMNISDRVAVLNNGEKISEGTPAEVVRDPRVVEAYLGSEESAARIRA